MAICEEKSVSLVEILTAAALAELNKWSEGWSYYGVVASGESAGNNGTEADVSRAKREELGRLLQRGEIVNYMVISFGLDGVCGIFVQRSIGNNEVCAEDTVITPKS